MNKNLLINNILETELICSMGCTEPSAIAFAVSYANEQIPNNEPVKSISLKASSNILKNALGVTLPNTNISGIKMIMLLGILKCNSKDKLIILNDIKTEDIELAKKLEESIDIHISLKEKVNALYIEVELQTENHKVKTIIEQLHDQISSCYVDDQLIFDNKKSIKKQEELKKFNFDDIYDFIKNDNYNKTLMRRVKKYNYEIGEYGFKNNVGLNIGSSLGNTDIYSRDYKNIISKTVSGIDSRMSGIPKKVIINSGSGNQGITATIPIVEFAKERNISKKTELDALTMSHLVAIYIRSKQNKLSSSCGAICAGAGVAAGIAYMIGCTKKQIEGAIINLLCSNFGVFCDGAKVTCSLKVASAVSSAINSAFLAKNNIFINDNYGVISSTLDKTLDSLGIIEKELTQKLDKIIMNEALRLKET